MTHTPGPWKFVDRQDGCFGVEIDNGHELLYDLEGSCPQCFANMRLIAAAPETLRQLKAARDAIASFGNDIMGVGESSDNRSHWFIRDELLGDIDAVIAKAEGNRENKQG